ncbi:acetylcholinesterase 3 AChE3 [Sarcoptes scabiei]|nr:acetylcholinesterase 3 AChE3 [Sarcoptes scabiei]
MKTMIFFPRIAIYSSILIFYHLKLVIASNNEELNSRSTEEHGTKESSLKANTEDIQINVGETASFRVFLSNEPDETIEIRLSCISEPCATIVGDFVPIIFTNKSFESVVEFRAMHPGHDIIVFNVINQTHKKINTNFAFVRVRVGRNQIWQYLSTTFGWGYFVLWSLSFWPQNVINFRRKSVIGLSFDYTILHFSGFLYYSIFNVALFTSPLIRDLYEEKYPRSEIPVELNDVVYSLHAAFTTSITWIQCFIYEQGDQRLSLHSKLFQWCVWSIGAVLMILAWLNTITWLTFIYYFSYIKLMVTSVKYLPQVWFNYQRKSTSGWSIEMVLLDISGGTFSMIQMLLIAYNYDDWRTLLGNLPKFGLGLASVTYDLIFLLQHYVLYGDSLEKNEETLGKQQKRTKPKSSNHKSLHNNNSTTILVENEHHQIDYEADQNS